MSNNGHCTRSHASLIHRHVNPVSPTFFLQVSHRAFFVFPLPAVPEPAASPPAAASAVSVAAVSLAGSAAVGMATAAGMVGTSGAAAAFASVSISALLDFAAGVS
jgi:hypothetical protein